ncbi:hypothetical protein Q5P01_011467 [Channa striata]|uniref:Uncharacterized protein n=1 Tax=Channa striata TaxID=64152 RepID=A0AA88MWD9_CHASR|nr:hypothetical protein Q5P01_011467 [Channa striata]
MPVAQEPSIITDNRLIGHHGLFNHEVKSIDIERLLSEQQKEEKSGNQVQDKNHAVSCTSSTSDCPPPFSRKDLIGAETNEVVSFEKNAEAATNAHEDYLKKEMKISTGSDIITPAQRPQQEFKPFSGGYKSLLSSKHSSHGVVIHESKKTDSIRPEKGRESQLSQTSGTDNVKTVNEKLKPHIAFTSPLGHTLENQKPPSQQTQARGLSPSPRQLYSSPVTESFDTQRRQNSSCMSTSVGTVAARLCDCLHFPFLKKRNLVTESREVLLKALRERHGPQLQENLFKVQQCHNFGNDLKKEIQDEEPTMMDEDVLFPTDVSAFQANTSTQPCLESLSSKPLKMTGSRHINWSNRQPNRSMERTAEWFPSPVAASGSLLEDFLRPVSSPPFFMDLWQSGASASDRLFSPSATSCWEGKTSAFQHKQSSFNRLNNRAVRERCGPHYTGSSIKLFPHPAQLPDEHSEPKVFPREPEQIVTDRHTYAPSFSAQMYPRNLSNQFVHLSTCPPPRYPNPDMMHYPPSHMLERDPGPPHSSSLSPEHWCFPPMRLY